MRTFNIYSLGNFQTYTNGSYCHQAALYAMPPGLVYPTTGSAGHLHSLPPSLPPTSGTCQSVLCGWVCIFLDSTSKRDHKTFVRVISLSIMPSRPIICIAPNGRIFLFLMAQWYSIVCIYTHFFTRSSINAHLGRFHVLAVINNVTVNTGPRYLFGMVILFPWDK